MVRRRTALRLVRQAPFLVESLAPTSVDASKWLYFVVDVLIDCTLLLGIELQDLRNASAADQLLTAERATLSRTEQLVELALLAPTVITDFWHEQ
jgi:hypothetical protein